MDPTVDISVSMGYTMTYVIPPTYLMGPIHHGISLYYGWTHYPVGYPIACFPSHPISLPHGTPMTQPHGRCRGTSIPLDSSKDPRAFPWAYIYPWATPWATASHEPCHEASTSDGICHGRSHRRVSHELSDKVLHKTVHSSLSHGHPILVSRDTSMCFPWNVKVPWVIPIRINHGVNQGLLLYFVNTQYKQIDPVSNDPAPYALLRFALRGPGLRRLLRRTRYTATLLTAD